MQPVSSIACSPRAQQILAAARGCFERQGFHGTSMAAIAAGANISVGHIYRYFTNKDAVIASLVEQDLQQITADFESFGGSPEEIASALLRHVEHFHTRMGTALWLEVMAEGARNLAIADLIQQAERRVQSSLRRAAAAALHCNAGEAPGAEAEERLYFIGVLLRGLQIGAFVEGKPAPAGLTARVKMLLTEILSDGLGANSTDQPAISRRTD